jgi:hypothetical protein
MTFNLWRKLALLFGALLLSTPRSLLNLRLSGRISALTQGSQKRILTEVEPRVKAWRRCCLCGRLSYQRAFS